MQKYFGMTTSDEDILKKDLYRILIERQAEEMLTGKNAVEMMDIDSLDIQLDVPAVTYFAPNKSAEGATGRKKRLEFFKVQDSMDKYDTGFLVTHEVKARQQENNQVRMSIGRCSRGLAMERDEEIFTTLEAGAGQTQAAADTWDGPNADPADDIANSIGKIMDNTYITDADVKQIGIYYPAVMWSQLAKPVDVNGIQKTLRNWAETEYMISFHPTRNLTTDALAVIKSEETAISMAYKGKDIPLAFEEQDKTGDDYTFVSYFKTFIIPETSAGTTTNRICSITDVAT